MIEFSFSPGLEFDLSVCKCDLTFADDVIPDCYVWRIGLDDGRRSKPPLLLIHDCGRGGLMDKAGYAGIYGLTGYTRDEFLTAFIRPG